MLLRDKGGAYDMGKGVNLTSPYPFVARYTDDGLPIFDSKDLNIGQGGGR